MSAVAASTNPALVLTQAMDSVISFFHQSCMDTSFTAKQFMEEQLRQNGDTSHAHSTSDVESSAHEVLVTTLPVCSNWVPDAMVGERAVFEVDRRVPDLLDSVLLPRPQTPLSVVRSRGVFHVFQVQDGVQRERDAVSRVLFLLFREQEGWYGLTETCERKPLRR